MPRQNNCTEGKNVSSLILANFSKWQLVRYDLVHVQSTHKNVVQANQAGCKYKNVCFAVETWSWNHYVRYAMHQGFSYFMNCGDFYKVDGQDLYNVDRSLSTARLSITRPIPDPLCFSFPTTAQHHRAPMCNTVQDHCAPPM